MHSLLRPLVVTLIALYGAVIAGVLVWAIRARDGYPSSPSRFWRGLELAVHHPDFVPMAVIAGAAVVGAVPIIVLIRRGWRWPYLVTAVAAAGAIVPVWLFRAQIWAEEARAASNSIWPAKSVYVRHATQLSIGLTVAFGLLAAVAIAAVLVAPRRSRVGRLSEPAVS